MKRRSLSTGTTSTTLIVGLLLILIVAGVVYILSPESKESILQRVVPGLFPKKNDLLNKKQGQSPGAQQKEKMIPSPTIRPLVHERVTSTISTSQKPNITGAIYDPYGPNKGETQRIGVIVSEPEGEVTSVTVKVKSDNKEREIPAQFTEGTKQNGTWTATWVLDDTINYVYVVTLIAENANGDRSVVEGVFKDDLKIYYEQFQK